MPTVKKQTDVQDPTIQRVQSRVDLGWYNVTMSRVRAWKMAWGRRGRYQSNITNTGLDWRGNENPGNF